MPKTEHGNRIFNTVPGNDYTISNSVESPQTQLDKSGKPLVLSAAQQETVTSVLASLEEAKGRSGVVLIIRGLSGTGKSAVLTTLQDTLTAAGVTMIENFRALTPQLLTENNGPFITSATLLESENIESELKTKGYADIIFHTLKSMTVEEATSYASGLNSDNTTLTPEQVATYSLGIPLLAQRILSENIDPTTAAGMAAEYLTFSVGLPNADIIVKSVTPLLSMPLPTEVITALQEISHDGKWRHIYSSLHSVLERRQMMEDNGIIEESPMFIASRSKQIYDEMMSLTGRENHKPPKIEIVVPNLTPSDFERIQEALDFTGSEYGSGSRFSRWRMFEAEERKAGIWTIDADGEVAYSEDIAVYINMVADNYVAALKSQKLPLTITNEHSILVAHKHAHDEHAHEVALFGWMLESLLQQRGIPYYVNNFLLEIGYAYNPETKTIEESEIISVV